MTDRSITTRPGEKQTDPHQSFSAQLTPLFLLTSIFFINFLARIVLAPLMPGVEYDLNMTHAEAGSLFLSISLGYFISLLGSGFISSRLTHKQTITGSATVLGLVLIFTAFSPGLWTMRLGVFMIGIAAGPYLPSGIATLTTLFKSRQWGRAIAIHELAPNLSFLLAPLICEALLQWFSWRDVFKVIGITALLLAVVFAKFGRGGEFKGEPIGYASYGKLLSNPAFWVMVILFSLGISSTMGVYSMLSLYLVAEHGMARNRANTLIALSRVASVGVALAGGWATDRFGPRRVLRIVFVLTGLMTVFIGLASTFWVTVAVFLQPIMAVCFFPAGLAALSMVSSARDRNIAVSLTVPLAFMVGGGAAPTFIGFMGDVNSFGSGIALVGGAILMGSIIAGYLRLQDRPDPN
ncbi:MAG: MFS transporter [Desulfobacteraceae bacterium]|jgi:NNP family nitrate/nitrite transporter-like MFS transporter|nr:MFS transporter [Desulfobacteraceae bacterium]